MVIVGLAGLILPAQAAAPLPGSADPSRQSQAIGAPVLPGTGDYELPTLKPRATVKVPPDIANVRFVLKGLTIEGATAYPEAQLRGFYQDLIGKDIRVADLYRVLTRIQQLYLDSGYTFTKVMIPPQTLDGGNITFRVVEGYVAQVEFEKKPIAAPIIDDAVARIKAMKPLNVRKLERLVLILNDQPDLHVGAVIAPPLDKDAPEGELRVIFRELDHPDPGRGVVTVDNSGSRYVGPWRLGVRAEVDHMGLPYSRMTYQMEAAKPLSELVYFGNSYKTPLFGASGASLTVQGSVSHSEPGSDLKSLDIDGRSETLGMSVSYPFLMRREQMLTGTVGFDFMDSTTDIVSDTLFDDRLRSLRVGLNYVVSDDFYGLNTAAMTVSKGLDILGVRPSGSPDLSRAAGRTDYTKVNATVSRKQILPHDFAFTATIDGQYTRDPLLSAEEYGFGGDTLGRGYDPSEILGDKGLALSLEVSKSFSLPSWKLSLQPYAFYDIGRVWNIDPGASSRLSAASIGAGLRMLFNNLWSGNAVAAVPLTKAPDNPPPYTNGRSPRFLLSLSRKF